MISTVAVLAFLRSHHHAVLASVAAQGEPQSALVEVALTDRLEIVFDTLNDTRKYANILADPRTSLVIGGWTEGDERTVQYQGIADIPEGEELQRLQSVYFDVFPESRARLEWPNIVYVRLRPTWIRYCDYNSQPPLIEEIDFPEPGE
jgi:general stress protein 26